MERGAVRDLQQRVTTECAVYQFTDGVPRQTQIIVVGYWEDLK
jgi:hypothetical protein